MAKITQITRLDVSVTFSIDESEARALEALAGYGDDAFIKVFYEKLGKAYMGKHEQGLRRFLSSIRDIMPGQLYMLDRARQLLQEEEVERIEAYRRREDDRRRREPGGKG